METTKTTSSVSTSSVNDKKKSETKNTIEQTSTGVHNIKLGAFQLQTKSFWISMVSLLSLFVMIMVWMNLKSFNSLTDKMMEHERQMIEMIMNYTHSNRN